MYGEIHVRRVWLLGWCIPSGTSAVEISTTWHDLATRQYDNVKMSLHLMISSIYTKNPLSKL